MEQNLPPWSEQPLFIPVPIVTSVEGLKLLREIVQDEGFWEGFSSERCEEDYTQFYEAEHILQNFIDAVLEAFYDNLDRTGITIMMPNPNYQP